jgi:hypothetical protein
MPLKKAAKRRLRPVKNYAISIFVNCIHNGLTWLRVGISKDSQRDVSGFPKNGVTLLFFRKIHFSFRVTHSTSIAAVPQLGPADEKRNKD